MKETTRTTKTATRPTGTNLKASCKIVTSEWDSDKVCRTCDYNRSGYCYFGDVKVADDYWCPMWK